MHEGAIALHWGGAGVIFVFGEREERRTSMHTDMHAYLCVCVCCVCVACVCVCVWVCVCVYRQTERERGGDTKLQLSERLMWGRGGGEGGVGLQIYQYLHTVASTVEKMARKGARGARAGGGGGGEWRAANGR